MLGLRWVTLAGNDALHSVYQLYHELEIEAKGTHNERGVVVIDEVLFLPKLIAAAHPRANTQSSGTLCVPKSVPVILKVALIRLGIGNFRPIPQPLNATAADLKLKVIQAKVHSRPKSLVFPVKYIVSIQCRSSRNMNKFT